MSVRIPLLLAALLLPTTMLAQQAPRITLTRTERAPVVDGVLDDPAWAEAAVLDRWVQTLPGDNARPVGTTRALITYDRNALFIAIHAKDLPGSVRYALHERDAVTNQGQDWVGILLDTFNDRRRAFGIGVNPIGVQGDGFLAEGSGFTEWDGIFESAGRVVGDEWFVELAIPFKSLRYSDAEVQTWGISLVRNYGRAAMSDSPWPLDRDLACQLCQMATLEGIRDIAQNRNLEINPTVLGRTQTARPQLGEPFDAGVNRGELGANIKYGITPNVTADVTINPDFSQVEADAGQLEINNRFALFFPEKRSFFLEGAHIFETQIGLPGAPGFVLPPVALVHTRRILDPQLGGKLTGKAGRVAFGLIGAADAAPEYELEAFTGVPRPRELDPFAGDRVTYGIARTRTDVLSDGFLGTTTTWRGFGDGHSLVVAADGRLRFGDNTTFRFLAATSDTRESDFSRPAFSWLVRRFNDSTTARSALDSLPEEATDLDGERRRGSALHAQLDYASRHWNTAFAVVDITPSFETPVGFTPRADQVHFTGHVRYIHQSTGILQQFAPQFRVERTFDHSGPGWIGRLTDVIWEPSLSVTLPYATTFVIGYHRAFVHFDGIDFDHIDRMGTVLSSKAFRWLHFTAGFFAGDDVIYVDEVDEGDPLPGRNVRATLSATVRPVPALRFELSAAAARIHRRADAGLPSSVYAESFIPRLKTQYQITRRLGLRSIVERRREDFFTRSGATAVVRESVLGDVLLSYVVHPGNAVQLGWTQLAGADIDTPRQWQRRGGIAKVSYVWRL